MDIRCFISVNLPDNAKTAIGCIITELRKIGADVKWVTAENIHLTLKFLGNTDESLIPVAVAAALNDQLMTDLSSELLP